MSEQMHGFFRVDTKGKIREWDNQMSVLTGHNAADTLDKSMALLIPEIYHTRHWKGFLAAMKSGAPACDQPILNVPYRHADETLHLHPVREVFLRDAFNATVGIIVIVGAECKASEDNGLDSPYNDALSAVG